MKREPELESQSLAEALRGEVRRLAQSLHQQLEVAPKARQEQILAEFRRQVENGYQPLADRIETITRDLQGRLAGLIKEVREKPVADEAGRAELIRRIEEFSALWDQSLQGAADALADRRRLLEEIGQKLAALPLEESPRPVVPAPPVSPVASLILDSAPGVSKTSAPDRSFFSRLRAYLNQPVFERKRRTELQIDNLKIGH